VTVKVRAVLIWISSRKQAPQSACTGRVVALFLVSPCQQQQLEKSSRTNYWGCKTRIVLLSLSLTWWNARVLIILHQRCGFVFHCHVSEGHKLRKPSGTYISLQPPDYSFLAAPANHITLLEKQGREGEC